jgi:hypothetical protein
MTDTAAAAAPSAPVAPAEGNAAPQTQPGQMAPAETPQERKERQRIQLSQLADDDEIVMVVDGKEVVDSAANARRRLQTDEAATRRFQAAKVKQAEAEALIAEIAQTMRDPRAMYREFAGAGLSPRQIAEEFLRMEAEEASLTPEQRRVRELESEREAIIRQREAEIEQQRAATIQQREVTFTRVFSSALEAAGLASAPQAVQDDCAWAFKDLVERAEAEGRRLTKADIARALTEAAQERARSYAGHVGESELLARLTPEMVAKWQAAQTAQVRGQLTPQAPVQRDASGRFIQPQRQPDHAVDVNGRRIIRGSVHSMFNR